MRTGAVDLLIAGVSARAAAFSAARAGLRVAAADRFGDLDLRMICDATTLPDWPRGLWEWTERFPAAVPLLPAGGSENEPELLNAIAGRRPVLSPTGASLARLRDPFWLADCWAAAGIRAPRVRRNAPPAGFADRWLRKRYRGGGGGGVCWGSPTFRLQDDEFAQEFIDGRPYGAAFLATANGPHLLGITAALIDPTPDLPFRYGGSNSTGDELRPLAARFGDCLADAIPLTGLFGIDFLWQPDRPNEVVPIEVNPRYTAGMEVLELGTGTSAAGSAATGVAMRAAGRPGIFGKKIVYANQRLVVPELELPPLTAIQSGTYRVADIRAAGYDREPRRTDLHGLRRRGSYRRLRSIAGREREPTAPRFGHRRRVSLIVTARAERGAFPRPWWCR